MGFRYYHETEITFHEIMNHLDWELRDAKKMDNERRFKSISEDFLKEVYEMIEGWYMTSKESKFDFKNSEYILKLKNQLNEVEE